MQSISEEPHCKILKSNGLLRIILNRPKKKNALSSAILEIITDSLKESAHDSSVTVVAISGIGDYFTSGNDLSNFTVSMSSDESNMKTKLMEGRNMLHRFQQALIDFPKPLIAAVNGHSVGIGVTLLALCDLVFAVETATFVTPFTKLGQNPECTSTFIFPRIMGFGKASSILMFGEKINAEEAKECNLVTEVYKKSDSLRIWKRIEHLATLPMETLIAGKRLMREPIKQELSDANTRECDQLVIQWQSDDFFVAISDFFMKNSKL